MTESIYQIPGSTPENGETLGVPQQNLDDARVDIALRAVREALGTEYKPSAETLKHTRMIDMLTRLQTTKRATTAVDVQSAAELRKSDYDLTA
jgi:ATP-dependent protease HslVU (ClpYQ) ATPase subunit